MKTLSFFGNFASVCSLFFVVSQESNKRATGQRFYLYNNRFQMLQGFRLSFTRKHSHIASFIMTSRAVTMWSTETSSTRTVTSATDTSGTFAWTRTNRINTYQQQCGIRCHWRWCFVIEIQWAIRFTWRVTHTMIVFEWLSVEMVWSASAQKAFRGRNVIQQVLSNEHCLRQKLTTLRGR